MNKATRRLKRWFRKYSPVEPFKAWASMFPDGEGWLVRKRGRGA